MPDLTATIPEVEGHSEIPTSPAADQPAALPDFMTVVPEKFRETQWVKDTAKAEKPFEAFFDQFENAQKTIGEKSKALEIPGPDATPEKIAEFRKARGVPDKIDAYEYTPPDISGEPEEVQKTLKARAEDQTIINKMRERALKEGITPSEFKGLASEFDALTIAQVRANVEAQKQFQEAARIKREDNLKQLYGDSAPSIIKTADDLLVNNNVIPEAVRKMNDPGLALIAALNYIYDKNFRNDKIGAANQGAPPMTLQSIRAKIMELTSKPEYSNFQLAGHKELKRTVESLYLEEDRMKKNKPE